MDDLVVGDGQDVVLAEAYTIENVISLWWYLRCTGSWAMYSSESCIHPMFHFSPNPSPPSEVDRATPSQAVDSSAIVTTPGARR